MARIKRSKTELANYYGRLAREKRKELRDEKAKELAKAVCEIMGWKSIEEIDVPTVRKALERTEDNKASVKREYEAIPLDEFKGF